jgi:hypothetical protein
VLLNKSRRGHVKLFHGASKLTNGIYEYVENKDEF